MRALLVKGVAYKFSEVCGETKPGTCVRCGKHGWVYPADNGSWVCSKHFAENIRARSAPKTHLFKGQLDLDRYDPAQRRLD